MLSIQKSVSICFDLPVQKNSINEDGQQVCFDWGHFLMVIMKVAKVNIVISVYFWQWLLYPLTTLMKMAL